MERPKSEFGSKIKLHVYIISINFQVYYPFFTTLVVYMPPFLKAVMLHFGERVPDGDGI